MTTDYKKPTEELLRSIDVHTLLPQQEPFVMIGSIIGYDNESTTSETVIKSDNIFVDNGKFSSAGMIENIAQTCAARIGYTNKYILHEGVQIGVIGAVRKLKVTGHPAAGYTITTRIDIMEDIMGVTLAMATITANGKQLAQGQIKLAVKG